MKPLIVSIFLLFHFINCTAQLCNGSLGDPIANITFGAGSNPGPALAAATTAYLYQSADCPNDGLYTVRNNSTACFSSSWYNLTSDHTGDPNGYFMLVNASVQPSAFYVDTVRNLCAGTTFEFAAWVLNIIKPDACNGNSSQPNLTFVIEKTDGTVIQSYNGGNIPPLTSPQWNQQGFFFTLPAGVSTVVLRIINNAAGGCGNDLALDDITFRPCGPTVSVTAANQTGGAIKFCQGTAKQYALESALSSGYTNPQYQWQLASGNNNFTDIPGASTANYNISFPASTPVGSYSYRLSVTEAGNTSTACRVYSAPIVFTSVVNPVAAISGVDKLCAGKTLQLSGSGGSGYVWSGPNGFTDNQATINIQNFTTAQAGQYRLIASNDDGCADTAYKTVQVLATPVVQVSFTDSSICLGSSVRLQASGGGDYKWTPAATLSSDIVATPIATTTINTTYKVVVTNIDQCQDSATVIVNVIAKAIANAGPDKIIQTGGSTILEGVVNNNYSSISWSPATNLSASNVLRPLASPIDDQLFVLAAASPNNCGTSVDSVWVRVFKGIFLPSAFTPNGDGINDRWNTNSLSLLSSFTLRIYNRYGVPVFESSNPSVIWDGSYKGRQQPTGNYVYIIQSETQPVIKGSVLLLR